MPRTRKLIPDGNGIISFEQFLFEDTGVTVGLDDAKDTKLDNEVIPDVDQHPDWLVATAELKDDRYGMKRLVVLIEIDTNEAPTGLIEITLVGEKNGTSDLYPVTFTVLN